LPRIDLPLDDRNLISANTVSINLGRRRVRHRGAKLRDLRRISREQSSLLAIRRRIAKPACLGVVLSTLHQRQGKPSHQFLPAPIRPQIPGAGKLIPVIQPAIAKGMFKLFQSDNQHDSISA
jgi:hypothetical protein